MKKLLVVCGLALLSVMPASAQFSWGIRGGLNLVNNDITSVNEESAMSKDSYTGYFFGPMAELQIPIIGIGIDASLLYSQKGLQLPDESTMKNQSIAIPVSLKYTFGLGNFLAVFAQAGPQFDYKIGDLKTNIKGSTATELKEFALNKSTWSINVGAGVKLINHIQAAVNYNIPVTKEGTYEILDGADPTTLASQGIEDIKSSTLQFIVTWTF